MKRRAMAVGCLLCASMMSSRATPNLAQAPTCSAPVTDSLTIGTSTLCIDLDQPTPARRALVHDWVERSANIVAAYYGNFPARLVTLTVGVRSSDGVGGGRTTNDDGLRIRVNIGAHATVAALANDWVMVHEMIHLALPEIGRRHLWLAEGLAVYVEGIARAQAGNRSVKDVWAEARRAMPNGLPQAGEGGMDQTSTWGRTYWGGALFCLQADVAIRGQTANQLGLQSALRAMLQSSGGYGFERSIEQTLTAGDAATGTHVLEDLYERLKVTPDDIDLDAFWQQLGVPQDPLSQPFDDHAALAAIRIKITEPMR